MNKFVYAIAVSMSVSGSAFAAAPSAIGALGSAAGIEAVQAEIPLPVVSSPEPAKALADDVLDLTPNYSYVLASYAAANGYTVLTLDGSKMTTKARLLSSAARELGLPETPENWDAFIDDLGDLPAALRTSRLLIMVRGSDKIRRADEKLYADFRDVARFVCQSARDWSRSGVSIKFAFVP